MSSADIYGSKDENPSLPIFIWWHIHKLNLESRKQVVVKRKRKNRNEKYANNWFFIYLLRNIIESDKTSRMMANHIKQSINMQVCRLIDERRNRTLLLNSNR